MKHKDTVAAIIGSSFFAVPYLALSVPILPSLAIGVGAFFAGELLFSKEKSVDYKDVMIINKYITDKGKIASRRMSGACSKHQRHIAQQIKYARFMALIPYVK